MSGFHFQPHSLLREQTNLSLRILQWNLCFLCRLEAERLQQIEQNDFDFH